MRGGAPPALHLPLLCFPPPREGWKCAQSGHAYVPRDVNTRCMRGRRLRGYSSPARRAPRKAEEKQKTTDTLGTRNREPPKVIAGAAGPNPWLWPSPRRRRAGRASGVAGARRWDARQSPACATAMSASPSAVHLTSRHCRFRTHIPPTVWLAWWRCRTEPAMGFFCLLLFFQGAPPVDCCARARRPIRGDAGGKRRVAMARLSRRGPPVRVVRRLDCPPPPPPAAAARSQRPAARGIRGWELGGVVGGGWWHAAATPPPPLPPTAATLLETANHRHKPGPPHSRRRCGRCCCCGFPAEAFRHAPRAVAAVATVVAAAQPVDAVVRGGAPGVTA